MEESELSKKVKTFGLDARDTWIMSIETCQFKCSFCAFHGKVEEIPNPTDIYNKFHNSFLKIGFNRFHTFRLSDPITNLKRIDYRTYLRTLLQLIADDKDYNIERHGICLYARINLMDDYYFELLEEFSQKVRLQIFFGIENLDDMILDDMNKGFKYKDVKEVFIKLSKMKCNFLISGSFIFGTPLDTEKSFNINIKRIKELVEILENSGKKNTFYSNPYELMEHSTYYENRKNYPLLFEDKKLTDEWQKISEYRASEFNLIADGSQRKMERQKYILDIDEDYFFLPVFSEDIIEPQSKRDEVYYKAPDQLDEVIQKFNMRQAFQHYKSFINHDEVYHELKQMEFTGKYKLIHIDAHSDIEYNTELQDVHLGNWVTHLIHEDIIDDEIIWIDQVTDVPSREECLVNNKKYYLNRSKLSNINFGKNSRIDITFWTRSPEFCPTNDLQKQFEKKLPNLVKLN